MNRLHRTQRQGWWSCLCILLVVLAALASVRPAQASLTARMVKDINPKTATQSPPPEDSFMAVGSEMYFTAHGQELWKSDGTATGTMLVKDFQAGPGGTGLTELTAVGATLFFIANDNVHGWGLWKSDGTAAGTMVVSHLFATDLTAVGNTLFFNARIVDAGNIIRGQELWKSDGTAAGTTVVKHLSAAYLTAMGSALFFMADDGVHGAELWKSDGTPAGTALVADIHPTASSWPSSLAAVGSTLFFTADDGVHGNELWKSNGIGAGTVLVKDINPRGWSQTLTPTVAPPLMRLQQ